MPRPNLIHFSFWEAKMTYFHPRRFAAWDENVIFASLKLKWIRLCLDKTVVNVIFIRTCSASSALIINVNYLPNFGQDCQGQADEAGCSFACGMEDADEKFQNLLNCMIDNDCMNKVTRNILRLLSSHSFHILIIHLIE